MWLKVTWKYICYFSISMIKHHDLGSVKKEGLFRTWFFLRVKVYNDRDSVTARGWQVTGSWGFTSQRSNKKQRQSLAFEILKTTVNDILLLAGPNLLNTLKQCHSNAWEYEGHLIQINTRRKKLIWLTVTVHHQGRSEQKVKAGTEAEEMEQCCLLVAHSACI